MAPLPPLPCLRLRSPGVSAALCFTSLILMSQGTLQTVMKTKPSLDGGADLLRNREAQEVPPLRNYLCLTMFTCFCPAWPINIVALVFSVLAQKSHDEEDYEGSKRLGQKALHLGITSFLIGFMIIAAYIIVHFTSVQMHQMCDTHILLPQKAKGFKYDFPLNSTASALTT